MRRPLTTLGAGVRTSADSNRKDAHSVQISTLTSATSGREQHQAALVPLLALDDQIRAARREQEGGDHQDRQDQGAGAGHRRADATGGGFHKALSAAALDGSHEPSSTTASSRARSTAIDKAILPSLSRLLDGVIDSAALARPGVDAEDYSAGLRRTARQVDQLTRLVALVAPHQRAARNISA